MKCTQCGKDLKPSAKFCTYCGNPVVQPSQPEGGQEIPFKKAQAPQPESEPEAAFQSTQEPPQPDKEPEAAFESTWPPEAEWEQVAEPEAASYGAAPPEPEAAREDEKPPETHVPPQGGAAPSVSSPGAEGKKFVWNEKYSLVLIAAAILIAVVLGIGIRSSREKQNEAAEPEESPQVSEDDFGEAQQPTASPVEDEPFEPETPEAVEPEAASYDTNIWDQRLPELPYSVYQQYYVAYYAGMRGGQIEIAVFDVDAYPEDVYLVWDGDGSTIELSNYEALRNCEQYALNPNAWEWVAIDAEYWRMADSAWDVISSNLDIRDSYGNMMQPHITKTGIPEDLDLSSYYRPRQEDPSEYILYGSDSRYITEEELEGLTEAEYTIAVNELYARHGRKFQNEEIQAYFEQFSWYTPMVEPEDFDESVFNEYETANRDTLVNFGQAHGFR